MRGPLLVLVALAATPTACAARRATSPPPPPARLAAAQAAADCWATGSWQQLPGVTTGPDRWSWVPSSLDCVPALPPLSRREWCRVHAGLRLLLVGDSLSLQHYRATLRLAGPAAEPVGGPGAARLWQRALRCATRLDLQPYLPGCFSALVCDGRTAVGFVRNDHLKDVRGRIWRPYPTNVLLHQWRSALDGWAPTHVVLNRGAHYTRDGKFRAGLQRAIDLVGRLAPHARIILRSTPPGHANCAAYRAPLEAPLPSSRVSRAYHWDDFRRQDGVMREVALESRALFLDVSTPTALRPDGHLRRTDCLHYDAELAPVYTWVRLLGGAVAVMEAPPTPAASPSRRPAAKTRSRSRRGRPTGTPAAARGNATAAAARAPRRAPPAKVERTATAAAPPPIAPTPPPARDAWSTWWAAVLAAMPSSRR